MKHACRDFRHALAAALGGGARAAGDVGGVGALDWGWHEHLLGCAGCRTLLASEEALEALLASLPEPRLDARARARVLARLGRERAAQADELDRLLEDLPARAPGGLSARVLAGLSEERAEAALDALLERWELEPAPAGLAARTAARLARARRAPARRRLALQLAAVLLAALGLGLGLDWRALPGTRSTPPLAPDALAEQTPPPGLLAALDLLESWDLINDPSLGVALSSLDEADAILLELERGRDPLSQDPSEG